MKKVLRLDDSQNDADFASHKLLFQMAVTILIKLRSFSVKRYQQVYCRVTEFCSRAFLLGHTVCPCTFIGTRCIWWLFRGQKHSNSCLHAVVPHNSYMLYHSTHFYVPWHCIAHKRANWTRIPLAEPGRFASGGNDRVNWPTWMRGLQDSSEVRFWAGVSVWGLSVCSQ